MKFSFAVFGGILPKLQSLLIELFANRVTFPSRAPGMAAP
jgi:hypothetical protein